MIKKQMSGWRAWGLSDTTGMFWRDMYRLWALSHRGLRCGDVEIGCSKIFGTLDESLRHRIRIHNRNTWLENGSTLALWCCRIAAWHGYIFPGLAAFERVEQRDKT